ncbi:MAG TPA: hypothetical protein VK689_02615 [Armatimonadota bacterium]|jgi:hypothetical protein|nr:hypothetical protein [Armatimonadota bacterium]
MTLPRIDDELEPKKRVDLRAIRPNGGDDATIDENSRRLAGEWLGGQKMPLASLRIEVPEYLDRELAMRAAERRVTKQYLVVQALRDAGYRVEEQDLVADKRKRRKV